MLREYQQRAIDMLWPSDLERGWQMFEALLDYWYAKTGLPRYVSGFGKD